VNRCSARCVFLVRGSARGPGRRFSESQISRCGLRGRRRGGILERGGDI
jgi:hypothetical protein